MKRFSSTIILLSGLLILFLQSCIHEYPYALGENPQVAETQIEISFNLYWQRLLHVIEFDTRDREIQGSHKFVIEILKDGESYSRDIKYLNDDEFSLGTLVHEISLPWGLYNYDVAVWYEKITDAETQYFNLNDFSEVSFSTPPPLHQEARQCAYATGKLVMPGSCPEPGEKLVKKIDLKLAGARFEIISTDVQKFIGDQHTSLAQGDTFSLNLNLHNNSSYSFDIYREKVKYLSDPIILSGDLFFPFSADEEMTIAQGFLFCEEEDEITMSLNVYNSARVLVTQTKEFTFPARRGYITTLRGDFLTNYLDGIFSINNIWEGEIVIEI